MLLLCRPFYEGIFQDKVFIIQKLQDLRTIQPSKTAEALRQCGSRIVGIVLRLRAMLASLSLFLLKNKTSFPQLSGIFYDYQRVRLASIDAQLPSFLVPPPLDTPVLRQSAAQSFFLPGGLRAAGHQCPRKLRECRQETLDI